MIGFLLMASLLGHIAFFVMVQLDHSPPGSDSVFPTSDALRLSAVQVLGALAVGFCAMGGTDFGLIAGKVLALPAVAGHAYGFRVWRRRLDAPNGTALIRRLEDILYAVHGAFAAGALLAAVLRA